MLIMMNSDNKKRGKALKCENKKDSFRFTWCNCWFKVSNSLWIWIAPFILSWKPVEACSKTWKLSAEHKTWQCGESFRCLKMWEALSLTKCSLTRVEKCRQVSPAEQASQPAPTNLKTTRERSPSGTGSFTPNKLPILKEEKTSLISKSLQ